MQIDAAVLRHTNTPLTIEKLELGEPQAGEVLIEMRAAGVCHSDWHAVTGHAAVDLPVVLGHEGSGVVADLGPAVDGLSVGDHVGLSWLPYCGTCRPCRHNHTNLCQTYLPALWAGTLLDGTRRLTDAESRSVHHTSALSTWSTHAVVPAISCVKMPDVPYEISALIGCAVTTGVGAAINKAKVRPGSTVAVFGGGGVGLSIVMGAAYSGATRIVVVDLNAGKEQLALSLGATHFVAVDDGIDPVEVIRDLTGGVGADYAFDAVGRTGVQAQVVASIAQSGTAVLVGLPPAGARLEVDPTEITRNEKTLTGSIFGSAHTHRDFVAYARLYADGLLPIDRLITDRYKLAEVNDACRQMLTGSAGRVVIQY